MTICAIYARVSDESQLKGDSIEHQINFCKEQARRKSIDEGESWLTPDAFIFVDEGITGTSMVKRPAVQRLIAEARAQAFGVVLFKGISRFARDTVDALLMLRALTACGVRIVSMEENFDSRRDSAEFIFTIHSALAQAESEKTAIRVRVGAAEKAKSGKWNGQPPAGYILNPVTKHLEIDESVAPLIRDIFGMYVGGMGVRKIADVLNTHGRFTKSGKPWNQRYLSRLLRNPAYVGDVVYGRRETQVAFPDASDPLARRKRAVWVDDRSRHVVSQNAHPGIVSRHLFEKVQRIMDERRQRTGPAEHTYLLTKGLLVCSCGSSMTITYNAAGTAYYRCLRQRDAGRSICNSGHIRARDLEKLVLQRVRSDVMELLQYSQLSIPKRSSVDFEQELKHVQTKLKRQMDRSYKLFNEYTNGHLLDEQYLRMNQIIQNHIKSLQFMREKLEQHQHEPDEQTDIETLVGRAMQDLVSVNTTNARLTREALRLFLNKVTAVQNTNGNKEISIHYRFAIPSPASKQ